MGVAQTEKRADERGDEVEECDALAHHSISSAASISSSRTLIAVSIAVVCVPRLPPAVMACSAPVTAAMAPISRMLLDVIKAAVAAGSLKVTDPQRAALLIQQTVMYGWLMNRFVQNSRSRVTAEDAWEFCLHGLGR